ncbi:MAG: PepSY-like domain-containing protein [Prevotella sp.]|nr:PepSY-like domain-containing protein [Prevotella sp.]MDY6248772.1 PepSY-like domain-containing protein [Prevotella sp.]
MKKQILLMTAFLCAISLGFTSCDDDEDIHYANVPYNVQNNFQNLFSIQNSAYVKWEKERGLYKAEFWHDGRQVEAWFQPDGTWVRTERDMSPMELPEAVKAYVEKNYPNYHIDDSDYVETPAGNYYELELERNGKRDVILRLTADGTSI